MVFYQSYGAFQCGGGEVDQPGEAATKRSIVATTNPAGVQKLADIVLERVTDRDFTEADHHEITPDGRDFLRGDEIGFVGTDKCGFGNFFFQSLEGNAGDNRLGRRGKMHFDIQSFRPSTQATSATSILTSRIFHVDKKSDISGRLVTGTDGWCLSRNNS